MQLDRMWEERGREKKRGEEMRKGRRYRIENCGGEKFVLFYAGMAFLSATSACLNTLYYFCGGNP